MNDGSDALRGQTALVTGGARGIGKSIAIKLAALGADIVVSDIATGAAMDETLGELRSLGVEAKGICFNVADEVAVEQAVKDIAAQCGRLDILVNNAGISLDSLLVRFKAEDWQRTIDVNLTGSFFCARAAAKVMMKARNGRIVNIASVVGLMGNAGQAAYAASKAGLVGLTKSMARELASRGITVNAVAPGYIQTDMTAQLSDEQREKILSQVPLGRMGMPEDVAEAVAFLVLPASGYVTGQVLSVNGGMYM